MRGLPVGLFNESVQRLTYSNGCTLPNLLGMGALVGTVESPLACSPSRSKREAVDHPPHS